MSVHSLFVFFFAVGKVGGKVNLLGTLRLTIPHVFLHYLLVHRVKKKKVESTSKKKQKHAPKLLTRSFYKGVRRRT